MRKPIAMRRSLMFVLIAAMFAAASACGGPDPNKVRVEIDGEEIAPDRIERFPFGSVYEGPVAGGRGAKVYVLGSLDDPATDGFLYPVYGKSPEGEWDIVVPGEFWEVELRRQPGSSRVYMSTCEYLSTDPGPPVFGQFRLHRITEDDEVVEVTDEYWGGLTSEQLDGLGISDCLASWAILPNGAVLLATQNSLWTVKGGHAEAVIDDLPRALGIQRNLVPWDPDAGRPDIRVGEHGEALLYLRGSLYNPAPLQPKAFRLVGAQVEPIHLGADYSIEDAAIGPDGAAYFLVHITERKGSFVDRGIRVLDGERSQFLRDQETSIAGMHAISIDVAGRMYLAYQDQREVIGSDSPWLLGFPTEDIIGRPLQSHTGGM